MSPKAQEFLKRLGLLNAETINLAEIAAKPEAKRPVGYCSSVRCIGSEEYQFKGRPVLFGTEQTKISAVRFCPICNGSAENFYWEWLTDEEIQKLREKTLLRARRSS